MAEQFVSNSEEETEALGRRLGEILDQSTVVAFTGDLGAGKTAFTRGLAKGLDIPDRVTSPTFTIVNEYEGGRLPLFHFDMYRIEQVDDLDSIGFWDYLSQRGIAVIEWSEHVMPYLPKPDYMVNIKKKLDADTFANENEREITVTIAGDQS